MSIGSKILNLFLLLLSLSFVTAPLFVASQSTQLIVQIGGIAVSAVFAWLVGLYAYKLANQTSTFHWEKPTGNGGVHYLWLFSLFILMFIVNFGLSLLKTLVSGTGGSENQDVINQMMSSINLPTIAVLVYLVFIAPVIEELIFRGVIINFFVTKHWWTNVIVSGVVFGSMHMGSFPNNWGDVINYVLYISLGVILAFTYKKSGNLTDSIIVHMLNNGLSVIPIIIMAIQS